jgi:ribosomal protein L11 methyltransferase
MSDKISATYARLHATGLAREDEEDFTQACFEMGANGVAEDLKFSQKDLRYDPDVIETPLMDVNVFFIDKVDFAKTIEALSARFPDARFQMTSEENKDWLAEWKKGFRPFPFAGPFWVIPSWLQPPAEAPSDKTKHIFVEPGMAFGTGTHETTRLAASLVIDEIERSHPKSLLDVGTGTGILALIAYRLGVDHLVGLDIDLEARRTARENLELNAATAIEIRDYQIGDESAVYDIVVANIIDGVLTILRHDLARALRPGGRMILSGVLMDREAEFYSSFTSDTKMRLIRRISEGEWSAALLEKEA